MSIRNLYGKRFTKLVVLDYVKNLAGRTTCKCICDCGKIKYVMASNLRNGSTRSCGCIKRTHGDTGTKLYTAWSGMKRRCREPHQHRYYGRGITVCPEWSVYAVFKVWALTNGYIEGLSLDRINNDGNYEPSNCRWITVSENSRRVIVDLQNKVRELEAENETLKEALRDIECELLEALNRGT